MEKKKKKELPGVCRDADGRRVLGEGAFEIMTDFAWLAQADRNAQKKKRYRQEILQFHENTDGNLLALQRELREGTYHTGAYKRIWVKIPKKRLVMALPYKDRIAQWALYQLLAPYYDKRFIEDSYACRIGKGGKAAVAKLQNWMCAVSRKPKKWYYLKLDISKYFYRVDHERLLEILYRDIKDEKLRALIREIVDNPQEPFGLPRWKRPDEVPRSEWRFDVGMPVGNLPSQLFANVYLNELDQFVKHTLHVRYYTRYMDDAILLADNKAVLRKWLAEIQKFLLNKLRLDLNDKTVIRPVENGVEFVGVMIYATHKKHRKSTARRMKRETRGIAAQYATGEISKAGAERRAASFCGMLKQANTASLRWRLNEIALREMGCRDYEQLPFGRTGDDRGAMPDCGAAGGNHLQTGADNRTARRFRPYGGRTRSHARAMP